MESSIKRHGSTYNMESIDIFPRAYFCDYVEVM